MKKTRHMHSITHDPHVEVPGLGHPGSFGHQRKHDVHTGVDLYTHNGFGVYAILDGIITQVIPFTGAHVGTPWWRNTFATIVYHPYIGASVLYGEIRPNPNYRIGQRIEAGVCLGVVKQVLKRPPKTPIPGHSLSMIHVELLKTDQPVIPDGGLTWEIGEDKPDILLDPTQLLLSNLMISPEDVMPSGLMYRERLNNSKVPPIPRLI